MPYVMVDEVREQRDADKQVVTFQFFLKNFGSGVGFDVEVKINGKINGVPFSPTTIPGEHIPYPPARSRVVSRMEFAGSHYSTVTNGTSVPEQAIDATYKDVAGNQYHYHIDQRYEARTGIWWTTAEWCNNAKDQPCGPGKEGFKD